MNKDLFDLRAVILKVLSESAKHGYQLVKDIEVKLNWKPSLGGIYPILKDLESKGLVRGHEMVEFGRFKKIYKLTDKGREELEDIERSFKTLRLFMES